ncbi:MAG: hypothetical protein ACXVB8_12455 [Bdellovibrionota bacterium]
MLLLVGAGAYAMDEDIPPPADSEIPAPQSSVGATKTPNDSAALNEDESIPAPSLGDESLPEPSVDRGQEKAKNQVNKTPEDDEIFLPTPNVNDNVYYAPVGTPAPRVSSDDLDWRMLNTNRPAFSLYLGLGFKSYPNNFVKQNFTTGYFAGVSLRVLNLAQTLFLHAYYSFSAYDVGDVGSIANVVDNTQHMGGMLELALGRHFSLFGTLLRRQALIHSTTTNPQLTGLVNQADVADVGEPPSWYLGAAAQWDLYVVPHGSIGLHFQIERDLYALTVAFAVEPAPRKKLSLNYGDMEQ